MDDVVYAFGQFEKYKSPADVPSEFRLLVPGDNDTLIGKLVFDSEAADSVMATWRGRGIDLMADYEHMSLAIPPVIAPASAKKWVPQVRNGEFWATGIVWTDKARQMIADGEYRYYSIACRLEKKTRRVVEVINYGLTNNPAANHIEPLVAASVPANLQSETEMKTLIVALGLRADASESDAITQVTRLRDLEREVLALTGKSEMSEALGTLRALSQAHTQLQALSVRMAQLESEKRSAEFDACVAEGVNDGKITPAMLDASKSEFGKWIVELRAKDDGVKQLRATVSALPKQIHTEAHQQKPDERARVDGEVTFGKDEVEVAERFGINLEKIAARRIQPAKPVTKHANGTVTIRMK